MSTIKQKFIALVTGANFWRAVVIYGVSLGIGLLGFFLIGGLTGDFMLACFPGFGSGVAIALLNNGNKQPVTLKSTASTFAMLLIFTIGSYILSISLLAVFVGFGLSLVGSLVGLRFCMWENKRYGKNSNPEAVQCKDNDTGPSQSNKS